MRFQTKLEIPDYYKQLPKQVEAKKIILNQKPYNNKRSPVRARLVYMVSTTFQSQSDDSHRKNEAAEVQHQEQ